MFSPSEVLRIVFVVAEGLATVFGLDRVTCRKKAIELARSTSEKLKREPLPPLEELRSAREKAKNRVT